MSIFTLGITGLIMFIAGYYFGTQTGRARLIRAYLEESRKFRR